MPDNTQARLDALNQEISEIERLATDHNQNGDRATLDYKALADAIVEKTDERRRTAAKAQNATEDYLEQLVEARVKALLDAQIPQRRQFTPADVDVPPGDDPRSKAPRSRYDAMLKSGYKPKHLWMAKNFMDGMARSGAPGAVPPSRELTAAVQKLMTSTGAGVGDEFVPTNIMAELWQDFYLDSLVVQNLRASGRVIDPMPTDPFNVPTMGDATWKGTPGQGQASAVQDLTTAAPVLTSKVLRAVVEWSYELDEDSVIAMIPNVSAELARSGAETMDAFALNADATAAATGSINSDDATPPTDAYYLSAGQDGIRHLYIVDNTNQHVNAGGDALTDADIRGALADMGKYGVRPEQTMIVVPAEVYIGMLGLDKISTMDAVGDMATYITGMVNDYLRIPVVISGSQPLAEADGKISVTASNNTLGTLSIFNRSQWHVGFRRGLLIESARDIEKQKTVMVASFRIAIACRGTRSSATHTAGIRNILV